MPQKTCLPGLQTKASRHGFTLVELLAVVAVVGILMTIIFAVFGTVRGRADQTKCVANLRQLQTASMLYAADHTYYAPSVINNVDKNGKIQRLNWYVNKEYLGLLGSEKSLKCPTHERLREDTGITSNNFSYGMNFTGLPGGWSEPNMKRTAYVSQVVFPSDSLAFADGVDWQIHEYAANYYKEEKYVQHAIAFRHDGKANIVHFDGSISSMTRDEIVGNKKLWKIRE